jgi:hypothetical protein
VLLRALRVPGAGRPSPLARLLAALVVLGMVGITAPVVVRVAVPVTHWLAGLL